MTIAIDDIVRVVLSYTMPNASIPQNVFYFNNTVSAEDDEDMLDALELWAETEWGVDWAALCTSDCSIDLLEVDVMNTDGTVDRNIGARNLTKVGTSGIEMLPAANAIYMQMETGRTKTLGKKYVPGPSESHVEDGALTAPAVVTVALLFAEYLGAIPWGTTAILVPGVLSRVAQAFYAFTGEGYLTDIPAYQRRRKPDVGS